jgi:hypothetical protein
MLVRLPRLLLSRLGSGRLHDVPRGDLADPAQLGREGVPNVIYFNEVDKGGHFAAWEEPGLFSEELRAAFPPAALADTRELGVAQQPLNAAADNADLKQHLVLSTGSRHARRGCRESFSDAGF